VRFLQNLLQKVSFRDQNRLIWHRGLLGEVLRGTLLSRLPFIALTDWIYVDLGRGDHGRWLAHRHLELFLALACFRIVRYS